MREITLLLLLFSTSFVFGQNVQGKWRTIDHESGKAKSVVEIYERNGKIYGKIIEVLNRENPEELICDGCPEDWKNKSILGLEIIRNLEKDDDGWYADDAIIDPERKKVYDCRLWREGDILKVRGYLGWLYSTQEWERVSD
jgi:uncharacterized protein (DUF2147 family)